MIRCDKGCWQSPGSQAVQLFPNGQVKFRESKVGERDKKVEATRKRNREFDANRSWEELPLDFELWLLISSPISFSFRPRHRFGTMRLLDEKSVWPGSEFRSVLCFFSPGGESEVGTVNSLFWEVRERGDKKAVSSLRHDPAFCWLGALALVELKVITIFDSLALCNYSEGRQQIDNKTLSV